MASFFRVGFLLLNVLLGILVFFSTWGSSGCVEAIEPSSIKSEEEQEFKNSN
jgi:hypothetical protein